MALRTGNWHYIVQDDREGTITAVTRDAAAETLYAASDHGPGIGFVIMLGPVRSLNSF
jgi:hypothetical protein